MPTFHVLSTTAVTIGSAIVPITLENTSTSVQTNVPFTFGQIFSEGHLPANGAAVELRAPDNSVVPCQMDIKTTHKDGSVRFAILSAIVPNLAASASVKYDIIRKAVANAGQAPVFSDYAGLSLVMTIKDTGVNIAGPTAGIVYNADLGAIMAQGKYTTWLSGPICTEWLVRVPLVTTDGVIHPDLHVRFNVRVYKGIQKAKIDYIVENTWVKPKANVTSGNVWDSVSNGPVIYNYDLKVGNVSLDKRMSKAYHSVRLNANKAGAYSGNTTNVPNDGTVYTAIMTIDGVPKTISVTGSAIQNFGQLFTAITTQLGGLATCTIAEGNLGFAITSKTNGTGSSVVIDGGTLYPILKAITPLNRAIQGGEYVHNAKQRWKKTVWWNNAPEIHIRHDKTYLINSKAIPNYPTSLTGNEDTINNNWNSLLANSDLGKNGITKAGMGAQGGAPGIGILPAWTSLYIINQSKKAKDTMLLQGDLMGSWGVINRDSESDEPINLGRWPYATYTGSGADATNPITKFQERLLNNYTISGIPGNPNSADVAHHPDFCFIPYMVTGDHFYMESMVFYLMYCCVSQNAHATYRDGAKCLFFRDQTRGNAWAMRTLTHNLYLLPDNHGHRPSLNHILASNVAWYNNNFVVPGAPLFSIFGRLREIIYEGNLAIGQFQEDFYTQAIGRAIELGFEEFLPMLQYRNLNIVGRLTSGTDFCWRQATLYALHIRAVNGGPEYTSWAEAYAASKPDLVGVPCLSPQMDTAIGWGSNSMHGYPNSTEGFPANLQPAVAYCAQFNLPKAKDAWMVLDSRSPKADYNTAAQFAIEPRTFINSANPGNEEPDPVDPPPDNPNPEVPVNPPPPPPIIGNVYMLTVADRVKDTSTTTGTGSMTVSGNPETGFRPILTAPIQINSIIPYSIKNLNNLNEWENGEGTVKSELVIERTKVTSSSNNNQLVAFSAGTKEVSVSLTASMLTKLAGVDSDPTTDMTGDVHFFIQKDNKPMKISLNLATQSFGQLDVLPAPAIDTDELSVYRGGVEYRASLTIIANAIKNLIGTTGINNIAPTFVSAQVLSGAGTQIKVVMSEALNAGSVPSVSAFTVTGKTVTAVAIQNDIVTLTLNSTYVVGDVINLTYTKPETGNTLQDIAGLAANSFGPVSVTNNLAAAGSTVSGVTVTPNTVNLSGGGTQVFSATVAGANSPSQGVNWSATAGTFSGNTFTAPAATNDVQTITVTAVSQQDSTKSGTATITVAAISLRFISLVRATESGTGPYTYTGSGTSAGYGVSEADSVLNKAFQAGIDGEFVYKVLNTPSGGTGSNEVFVGIDTSATTGVLFSAMDYGVNNHLAGYRPFTSGTGGTQTTLAGAANDLVKVTRVGSNLTVKVSKDGGATYPTTVGSWTVPTGVLYIHMLATGTGSWTPVSSSGLV